MPNIKSAIKRVSITERNRLRNKTIKSRIKTTIRKFKDQIASDKNDSKIGDLLNQCYRIIDQAVTKGVYHKNSAARKKSRLSSFLKRAKNSDN